mmetsp:Transcript_16797/g.36431  ORF Transcript_16797/g.36431 Transcript_16797/m.36431 type:complete len:96 (+) Transcript_16797:357-644(+)
MRKKRTKRVTGKGGRRRGKERRCNRLVYESFFLIVSVCTDRIHSRVAFSKEEYSLESTIGWQEDLSLSKEEIFLYEVMFSEEQLSLERSGNRDVS